MTSHDGFPLLDQVSYNEKHNEANLEDNRDGEAHNRSWNCGVEGATDDAEVLERRTRQQRNFLATLLLSQGVPMLTAGDEFGRTQQGNNNAYCQDNEISWVDWSLLKNNSDLADFVCRLLRLRKRHPEFRRRHFFQGSLPHNPSKKDIYWLKPDGKEMLEHDWHNGFARCLGLYMIGDALLDRDPHNHRLFDDDFVMLLNTHYDAIPFTLPPSPGKKPWRRVLDTALGYDVDEVGEVFSPDVYPLQCRSLVLLKHSRTN